jgi:SnoaL-like protein
MKTTEELVRELADREAIRDLAVRYCDCLWRDDLEGLLGLFKEDGTFVVEGHDLDVIQRGRAHLKKMYASLAEELRPRPFIHNHLIELRGKDRGIGRCYVELRSENHDMEWFGSGYYEDEYSKVNDQWKFASRRHIRIGSAIALRSFMAS